MENIDLIKAKQAIPPSITRHKWINRGQVRNHAWINAHTLWPQPLNSPSPQTYFALLDTRQPTKITKRFLLSKNVQTWTQAFPMMKAFMSSSAWILWWLIQFELTEQPWWDSVPKGASTFASRSASDFLQQRSRCCSLTSTEGLDFRSALQTGCLSAEEACQALSLSPSFSLALSVGMQIYSVNPQRHEPKSNKMGNDLKILVQIKEHSCEAKARVDLFIGDLNRRKVSSVLLLNELLVAF